MYLIENELITGTPEEIAHFLFTDNLNMTKIGDYLGENKPENLEVLKQFVDTFDFTQLQFDEAIRIFLSNFRLPGEAQKIDRIMEAFAKRYCECNPTVFPSPDSCYVLAFSLIMLNTDLHNNSIKKKMTKKDFIHNNRGIANGTDLPSAFLENLFDGIKKTEIKVDSNGLFGRPAHRGWLEKQGTNQRYQRHYCVVTGHCLYYFNSPEDTAPHVIIPLEGLDIREKEVKGKKFVFELFNSSQNRIKSVKLLPTGPVEGQHKEFIFAADSSYQLQEWIEVIRANTVDNPIQQLINSKKQQCTLNQQEEEIQPSETTANSSKEEELPTTLT